MKNNASHFNQSIQTIPITTELKPQFVYTFHLDAFFKDRTKKRFSFEKASPIQLSWGDFEPFELQCMEDIHSEVDKTTFLMTWARSYVTFPSGKTKQFIEYVPELHFGLIKEPCFI